MSDKIDTRVAACYLKMLAPMISEEETRYYLNGVLIEPHPDLPGVVAVATNGHILGAVYDKDGRADKGRIFPISKALLEEIDKHDDSEIARFDGKTVEVIVRSNSETIRSFVGLAQEIDGTFPDWRRVVPKIEASRPGAIAFNPRYVSAFAPAAADQAVVFNANDASGPALFRFVATPEFVGVLMPMSGWDDVEAAWPDWLEEKKEQAA